MFQFFGEHLYHGQRYLYISEGEEDAMSADFMLNRGVSKSQRVLCVSLPFGVNLKAFKERKDFLAKFEKVVFDPDGDEAGLEIVEELASLYPDILLLMGKSEKDANAMLLEKKQQEFLTLFTKSGRYKPQAIIELEEHIGLLDNYVKTGLTYPWECLTCDTYGI